MPRCHPARHPHLDYVTTWELEPRLHCHDVVVRLWLLIQMQLYMQLQFLRLCFASCHYDSKQHPCYPANPSTAHWAPRRSIQHVKLRPCFVALLRIDRERVEERMMEWNSLQRRRRPLLVMYCSQQWRATTDRPDETRYALNELADMPHARVMDMKMAWRALHVPHHLPAPPAAAQWHILNRRHRTICQPQAASKLAGCCRQLGIFTRQALDTSSASTCLLALRRILYIIGGNKSSAVIRRYIHVMHLSSVIQRVTSFGTQT